MRFTVNTKPRKNVTSLGIIKANISQFYYRSGIVQITASRDNLILNIEASGIKTKMVLRGSGDEDTTVSTIVDCAKFKQLIDRIESTVLTIEFIEAGIVVCAGRSRFSVPQMVDVNDMQLDEPLEEYDGGSTVSITPTDWQFVKDHQMYAISKSKDHPVYTYVWLGENHDVIVGDIDIGRFTYSHQGTFDTTCLLPPSLVNLFTSIPANSVITKVGKSYILNIETDSYSMITEFTPKYEDDDSVGSYNSAIILSRLTHPEASIIVDTAPLVKFLSQTAILTQSDEDKAVVFTVEDNKLTVANRVGKYSADANTGEPYSVKFQLDLFKGVIANFDSDEINIAPLYGMGVDENGQRKEMPVGCIFWTDNLTVNLAGCKA